MKYIRSAFLLPFVIIFVALAAPDASSQETTLLVTDFTPPHTQNGHLDLPKGWTLKVWQGTPDVKIVGENGESVLRLRSDKAAVSIYREVTLDLSRYPMLSWRWKVTKLPPNADARVINRDDQAAGLYVIFPRFPSFVNSQIIGYIWETSVPEGAVLQSQKNSMVHYIVVRSGRRELNKWVTEKRNVLEDYRRVFGQEPPMVGGISLMIDTDDTRSQAESYFARVEFSPEATANLKPPPNRFVKFLAPELILPK